MMKRIQTKAEGCGSSDGGDERMDVVDDEEDMVDIDEYYRLF